MFFHSIVNIFIQVVFVLVLISFAFWITENMSPAASGSIREISKDFKLDVVSNENILIYNSEAHRVYGFIRNAGFAYEGGAYSIILIIALICNLLKNKYVFDLRSKTFVAAILSTFSTAGYIAASVLIYGYWFTKFKSKLNLIVFSILYLSLIFYAYQNLTFLEDKIQSQVEISNNINSTKGRFASALADLREWQRNPIFGVGKFEETRFKIFRNVYDQHRTNGMADFLAKFGLIVFIGYFGMLFISLKKINISYLNHNKFTAFQYLALLMAAFSQTCLQWSVFIMLLYVYESIPIESIENEKGNYPLPQ